MSKVGLISCLLGLALWLPFAARAAGEPGGTSAPIAVSPEVGDDRHSLLLSDAAGRAAGGDYSLASREPAPQFRVTYPLEGEVLHGDVLVQAESNLPPEKVRRVAFYLESASAPRDAPDNLLYALGTDRDGRDGWSISLDAALLESERFYRILLLATDMADEMIPAWSGWFTAQAAGEPLLWLPGPPISPGELPRPLRRNASLEAIVRREESFGQEPGSFWDLYLVPQEMFEEQGERIPTGDLLTGGYYVASLPAPRFDEEWILNPASLRRYPLGPFDSAALPDGRYVALLVRSDPSQERRVIGRSRPLEIDNTIRPTVKITAPREGQVIQRRLFVTVEADDLDGIVERVDFYIERCGLDTLPAEAPCFLTDGLWTPEAQVEWVGSDRDGSDGWSVERWIQPAWDGDCWRVIAVAVDDRGLATNVKGEARFTILGRERPLAQFEDPLPGCPLAGEVTVTVRISWGLARLEGIQLYIADTADSLSLVGPMEPLSQDAEEAIWSARWDTRQHPDGDYALYALVQDKAGRATMIRRGAVSVRNHLLACTVTALNGETRRLADGQVLSGTVQLTLDEAPLLALEQAAFYYRDAHGQLYPIGEDTTATDGWAVVWPTATALDGSYDLVVHARDVEGRICHLESRVTLRNQTPTVVLEPLAAEGPLRGPTRLIWHAQHPQGKPLTATLSYSLDGGDHWLPLASDLPASGTFLWELGIGGPSPVVDTNAALVRLTATDGTHYAQAISAPFAIDLVNDAPRLTILVPERDHTYGVTAHLRWQAWDADGDPLRIAIYYRRGDSPWEMLAGDLENSGAYEWDTYGLPAGEDYAVRITVTDPWGVTTDDVVERIGLVPNTPPVVRLLWPSAAVHLDKETVVLWRAYDDDGDELRIDLYYSDNSGRTWIPLAEDLPNSGYYQWQVSFLPVGGQYRMRIVARDEHFRVWDESSDVFAIGWRLPPQVELLAPLAGARLVGLQSIRWLAYGPGLANLRVSLLLKRRGTTLWQTLADALPNDGYYLWDTTTFEDGDYDLRVLVSSGNVSVAASLSRPVRLENQGAQRPQGMLLSPRGGERWSGLREITWRAWDLDSRVLTATLEVDAGSGWRLLDTVDAHLGYYLWDTRQVEGEGPCLLRLTVTDGDFATEEVTPGPLTLLNRDNYPPEISLISPDADGILSADKVILWQADDADGDPLRISLALSRDGGLTWEEGLSNGANDGEHVLSTPPAPDAAYRLALTACDETFCVQRLVEVHGPPAPRGQRPRLALLNPIGGEHWAGEQAIRWQATSPSEQEVRLDIAITQDGGQSWHFLGWDIANTGVYVWDTRRVGNGWVRLRLTADDGRYRTTLLSAPLQIDNPGGHAPQVSLISPRGGEVWTESREIVWHARDADGDPLVARLMYRIAGDATWYPIAAGLLNEESYVWDTTTIPNAARVWLRVTVSDGRLSSSAQTMGSLAVRNRTAPVITITKPRGGDVLGGEPRIAWHTLRASELVRVTLETSTDAGKTWQPLAADLPPQGEIAWDVSVFPNGTRVLLRARAAWRGRRAVDILRAPVTIYHWDAREDVPFYMR